MGRWSSVNVISLELIKLCWNSDWWKTMNPLLPKYCVFSQGHFIAMTSKSVKRNKDKQASFL